MSHRWLPPVRAGLAALIAGLIAGLIVGCGSGSVEVAAPEPDPGTVSLCEALVDALPEEIAGETRRTIDPSDALAAAWGDPAIVLRCGVRTPAGVGPTTACFEVDGVGWSVDDPEEDGPDEDGSEPEQQVFTTIGRASFVEITVPAEHAPAAEALVAVAQPIIDNVPVEVPCV